MIAETKDFIERFKGTYSKTFQVQSRVKMLEKLELIEVDEEDTSRLRLKFPPSPRSGAYPVQMSDVAMSFDGKKILQRRESYRRKRRQDCLRGKKRRGQVDPREVYHGPAAERRPVCNSDPQRADRLFRPEPGFTARRRAHRIFQTIDDVAKGEVRNKIRDLAWRLCDVWRRGLHQEGEGALRRRAHPPGHPQAAAGAGQPADPRRAYQPPRPAVPRTC